MHLLCTEIQHKSNYKKCKMKLYPFIAFGTHRILVILYLYVSKLSLWLALPYSLVLISAGGQTSCAQWRIGNHR